MIETGGPGHTVREKSNKDSLQFKINKYLLYLLINLYLDFAVATADSVCSRSWATC